MNNDKISNYFNKNKNKKNSHNIKNNIMRVFNKIKLYCYYPHLLQPQSLHCKQPSL